MNYNPFRASVGSACSAPILQVVTASLAAFIALACFTPFTNFAAAADPAAWQTVGVPEAGAIFPKGTASSRGIAVSFAFLKVGKVNPWSLLSNLATDARQWFWNGEPVAAMGQIEPTFRSGLGETKRFPIPADKLPTAGDYVLTIRSCISSGRSGFNVAAPVLFSSDGAIRLAGDWQKRSGDDLSWAKVDLAQEKELPVFSKVIDPAIASREFTKLGGDEGPLSPAESLARMKTPEDLRVDLVLSEPELCQPLSIKWDTRGRLWAIQYLQYPSPAGLTTVSRDKFLRTVYDRLPAAPPNHFPGQDKITIHEDTDGDGKVR